MMEVYQVKEEIAHEAYCDSHSASVFGTIRISSGDRQDYAVAWAVCNKPFCRAGLRENLLRICMPHEHIDDTGRADFEKN